jgi:hypothetical protein
MIDLLPYELFRPPYPLLWLPTLLLALPVWIKTRAFGAFLKACLIATIGIVIPIYWFGLSTELKPDWKGDSPWGWFASFAVGKVWLSPLIIWAASAFYARVIWRCLNPLAAWIVFGYIAGAAVSLGCLTWALLCLTGWLLYIWPFIPPIGVATYYTLTARKLLRERPVKLGESIAFMSGTLPFWIASLIQSQKFHQQLPDQPPDCFVVTAASLGHSSLVGPFFKCQRQCCIRQANQQLMTFWAFEQLWVSKSPRSHRLFRAIYNRVGPRLAARIRNPWLADMAYLMLKPAELLASLLNSHCYTRTKLTPQ